MLPHLCASTFVALSFLGAHLSIASQPAADETADPMQLFEEAQEDRINGRLADSLRKLEWLFRKGHEVDPAFDSVRVSFVIGAWADLANDFPPARARLVQLQNAVRQSVLSATKESVERHFREFDVIAHALDTRQESVAIFKQLCANNRPLAVQAISSAKDAMFEQKEYKLLSEFIDPASEYGAEVNRYKRTSGSRFANDEARRVFRARYEERTLSLIDMLIALEKRDEAIRIARDAMEISPGVKFKSDVAKTLGNTNGDADSFEAPT